MRANKSDSRENFTRATAKATAKARAFSLYKAKYFVIALLLAVVAITSVGVSKWNIHIQQIYENNFSYVNSETANTSGGAAGDPILTRYLTIDYTETAQDTPNAPTEQKTAFYRDTLKTATFTYNGGSFKVKVSDDEYGDSQTDEHGNYVQNNPDASPWSEWEKVGLGFTYAYKRTARINSIGQTVGCSEPLTDGAYPTNAGVYQCVITATTTQAATVAAKEAAKQLNYLTNPNDGTKQCAAEISFTIKQRNITVTIKNKFSTYGDDHLSKEPLTAETADVVANAENTTDGNLSADLNKIVRLYTTKTENGTTSEYKLEITSPAGKYGIEGSALVKDTNNLINDNYKVDFVYPGEAAQTQEQQKVSFNGEREAEANPLALYVGAGATAVSFANNTANNTAVVFTNNTAINVAGKPQAQPMANGGVALLDGETPAPATNGTYTITTRKITVTIENQTSDYGDAIKVLNYSVTSGSLANEDKLENIIRVTTTAESTSNFGEYPITGSQYNAEGQIINANYAVTFVGTGENGEKGVYTITKRSITVTIADKTSTYGDPLEPLTATTDDVVANADDKKANNGNLSGNLNALITLSTTATSTSNVGDTYAITGSQKQGFPAQNYAVTFKGNGTATTGVYTITKRQVTIAWSNLTLTYNGNAQKPTATAGNLVNGDSVTVTGEQTNAGQNYTATATISDNYDITNPTTQFTINEAELTATASSHTVTYGDDAPSYSITYSGFVKNETATTAAGFSAPTISCHYQKGSPVTTEGYAVTLSGGSATNYSFKLVNGKVTVNKATVTVPTATSAFVYSGTEHTAITDYATALITIAGINTATNVDNYTATATLKDTTNYKWSDGDENATKSFSWEITPAPLTVTADDFTITKGSPKPNFTATYDGFVNNETQSVLSGTLAFDCSYNPSTSDAGTYPITPKGLTSNNYDIDFQDGALTVTQADVVDKPTVNTAEFTFANNVYTATYDGTDKQLLDGVDLTKMTVTLNGTNVTDVNALTAKNAGTYTVIVTLKDASASWEGGGSAPLTFNFIINPKPVTITWGTTTFTYNGSAQKPTATVSNLCQGDTCTVTVAGEKTNAGQNYTATASQLDNDNYTLTGGSNLTTNFTIEKASLNKPQQNAGYPFTYDGSEKTYLTGIDLDTMTFTGNNKATNAGDYTATVSIKYKTNYKWADGTDTDLTFNWSISSRVISFNGIIVKDYKDNKGGITLNADLLAGKISNLVSGANIADILTINYARNNDALTVATNDENNGKFYYDSGSTIKAGSTYEIKVTLKKNDSDHYNYVFGENSATGITHLKYQTAMIGETYYTIEDALNKGEIVLAAADFTLSTSYVITAFSKLGLSGSPADDPDDPDDPFVAYKADYNYTNSSKIILPYTSGVTASSTQNTNNNDKKVGSVLILQEGVTLTTTGAIDITAIISFNGLQAGVTATRAVLMNHGTLNVSGTTLTAYGYLKGTGTVELLNGSKATDIFRIYDFKGGGNTLGIVGSDHWLLTVDKHNYFPINSYSIHNISCKTKINSGCFYNAQYEITMGGKWFSDPVKIVGNTTSGTLFKLNNGYIEKSAAPAASWKDTNPNYNALNTITGDNQIMGQKERINIYGTAEDGRVKIEVSLDIKIATVTLPMETSNDNPLPISYMDITVGKKESNVGNLTLSNSSYKFMPGSSLTVEDGASLTVGQNTQIVLYSVDDCTVLEKPANYYAKGATTPSAYPYDYITKYCIDKSDSWLNIGGTVNIYGRISGEIKTNNSNATLTLTNTSTDITVLKDFHAQANTLASFEYATVTDRQSSTVRAMKANGLIWTSASASPTDSNFSAGTYKSDGEHWYKTGNYTITYNPNGGSVNTSGYAISGEYGKAIGSLPYPSRTGYKFNYWAYNNKEVTATDTFYFVEGNALTLTAVWTAYEYTVSFDTDGVGSNPASIKVPYNGKYYEHGVTAPTVPTGYVFDGWYTAKDGGNLIDENTIFQSTTAVTLYARWSVKVTIYNNVTDNETPREENTPRYAEVQTLTAPTHTGYLFDGWSLNKDGERLQDTYQLTSPTTLYARWEAVTNLVTITFNHNYGGSPTIETSELNAGSAITKVASRTGYTFLGWFNAQEGGNKVETVPDVATTLYAHWTANTYTVSFDTDGVGTAPPSITVTFDGTYGVTAPTVPTGYVFDGWYTAQTGGTLIEADTTVSTASNITLYARWKVIVTLDANGGSSVNPLVIPRGSSLGDNYSALSGIVPTREHYRFDGWTRTKDDVDYVVAAENDPITEPLPLYAHWTLKSYTIKFVSQEHLNHNSSITKNSGETISFSDTNIVNFSTASVDYNIEKQQYFTGWKCTINNQTYTYGTNDTFTLPDISPYTEGETTITFTAVWANKATVKITMISTRKSWSTNYNTVSCKLNVNNQEHSLSYTGESEAFGPDKTKTETRYVYPNHTFKLTITSGTKQSGNINNGTTYTTTAGSSYDITIKK